VFPFSEITATWEPAIGALLLIFTLIAFPGGIAQQQAPLLRWLSFRRGHAASGADGAGTGSTP
jgi:hypothetical protein